MEDTLHIESLASGSAAIARRSDGKAVFVEGAAPGDTVRVRTLTEKGSYATAEVVEVLDAGACRVAPSCPLAGTCGGCSWQHISYDQQLDAKRQNIVDALVRIGHMEQGRALELVAGCLPSKRTLAYRNKLEFACTTDANGRLVVGMHKLGSDDVVAVGTCPLAARPIQKASGALQGALRYLEGAEPGSLGIFRIGVRASVRTHSLQVALWTTPGPFPRQAVAKTLAQAVRATSIVRVLAQPGHARKVKGVEVLAGAPVWEEQLGDYIYQISAPSFFQVNTAQAEKLVELVVDGLEVSEDARVADLYCGAGTFTLPLAETDADVIAVESAGPAVRDLRRNLEDAGLWAEVVGGDALRELADMGRLDALVVDPPRAGLADGVPELIARAHPRRMAYVSCDPATWARDIARLQACGYVLQRAVPVDLFPQTHHCEVASFLEPA